MVTPTANTDFLLLSIKSSNLSKHPVKLYFLYVPWLIFWHSAFASLSNLAQQLSGTVFPLFGNTSGASIIHELYNVPFSVK